MITLTDEEARTALMAVNAYFKELKRGGIYHTSLANLGMKLQKHVGD